MASPGKVAQRLNCSIGDLAIVVSAVTTSNIGQIVEVLGPATGKPFRLGGHGHVWQVRTASRRRSLHYSIAREVAYRLACGPVPDCCLRPLPRLPVTDASTESARVSRNECVARVLTTSLAASVGA